MNLDQDIRTMLQARAEEVAAAPVIPHGTVRRVRVRKALMTGGLAAVVAALVFGGFAASRSLLNDAAPVQPADENEQAVPGSPEALVEDFLQARIEGEGAEDYVEVYSFFPMTGPPLLYATTNGAPYEGFEFERGPDRNRPERMEFEVRLFAEDGETVVEQRFFWVHEGSRFGLEYWPTVGGIAPTTENGDPVPEEYVLLDGELTLQAAHPWAGYDFGVISLALDPNHDGGPTISEHRTTKRLQLWDSPRPEKGCRPGPAPADAEALARTIRSDPNLAATTPAAVTVGGIDGLRMDVTAVPGASVCGTEFPGPVVLRVDFAGAWRGPALEQGSRMRLYLLNVPEGTSTRILGISIAAPEPGFGRVMEAAQPVLDSITINAP